MTITADQLAKARESGYTDAEILDHLGSQYDDKIKTARDAGYQDSEILAHLAKAQTPAPTKAPELADRTIGNVAGAVGLGAIGSAGSVAAAIRDEFPEQYRHAAPKAPTPVPTQAGIPNITITGSEPPPNLHGGEKWTYKGTGVHIPGAQMEKASLDTAKQMAHTVGRGGELAGGKIINGVMVGPQTAAERIAGQAAETISNPSMWDRAKAAAKGLASSDTVKSINRNVGNVLHGATSPFGVRALSGALSGASAGYQAADAAQRLMDPNQGVIRGLVSGIGALGSGATLSRMPAFMLPGMAASIAAPYINKKLDEWAAEHPEAAKRLHLAEGGSIPEIPKMAGGGKADLLFQAIKSAKQLGREAGYVHDIVPTHKFSTPKQISIQDLQGKTLVGVPGDRTLTGHEVRAVNRVPLSKPVEQQGGPMYGLRQQDLGNPYFWASNDAAAIGLQNKARRAQQQHGSDVFGMYTAMAPDAGNYALHTTETLLNQIPAMNPRKKDIAAFDKMIRQQYPSFAGVTDPDVLEQLARDSKMRKFLAERLNKTTVAEQYGMPSGEATIHAITEPELRNVPVGNTGFTVGRLHPEKELTPNIDVTHGTYNTNIPGEFQGQMIAQLPWQMYFPEAAAQIARNPKQAPHAWGTFKMGDYNQPVTQELVDKIAPLEESILAGKQNMAEGGVVNMDKGGLASLAKKALRKYGVGVGLTAPFAAEAGQEAAKGNIGSVADLASGFLPAPAMAAYMGLSPSETAPMHMDQYPGRQGTNPLAGSGSVMENYVPGMAGGGDVLKAIKKAAGVGSRTIEGSPHTYPPIAEGPWMRDYQPATRPEPGFKFPVLEAGAPTDQPYLVKQGSTYTAANVPMPSEQRIQQMGLKNALATQSHPALREAQDRSILALMDQKRMNYIQNILKSDPSTSMEELLQMYPRYETWMR